MMPARLTAMSRARIMHQPDLRTDELDYELPRELIATRPCEPRDAARLLVVRRSQSALEHARVRDLPRLLAAGDTLVFNTSAVAPARLEARRVPTGGRVEGLFLQEQEPGLWRVMLAAGGRLGPGDALELAGRDGRAVARLRLLERDDEGWVVRLDRPLAAADVLDRAGRTPLPPYVRKARGTARVADERDRAWYQTVYADPRHRESVAAPTAGLHFTPELLGRLGAAGIGRVDVMLHVGPGTFRPVTAATLAGHHMHAERYAVSPEAAAALERARCGGRVVAVGTTTVRTLESLPEPIPSGGFEGSTDLLIAPGYAFARVDGLLTNFHLPRSTLLALVAAMLGLERTRAVYAEAVARRYRFYSFGDAMLVMP